MIVYEYGGGAKGKEGAKPRLSEAEFKERLRQQDFQNISSNSFSVQRILEGEFSAGQLTDYGRVLDAEDGICQVGYWKPMSSQDLAKYFKDQRYIQQRSVPWGQWAQYQPDGTSKKGFEEGIYMGRSKRNPNGFKQI